MFFDSTINVSIHEHVIRTPEAKAIENVNWIFFRKTEETLCIIFYKCGLRDGRVDDRCLNI